MVVITERATDSIVTYELTADGTFGPSGVVASEGPTPYGFAFTSGATLIVTEAFGAEKGAAAASSYAIEDGSLVARSSSVGNGRSEICWAVVTPDDRFAFTTNFADGAVSRYAIAADGSLSHLRLVGRRRGLARAGRVLGRAAGDSGRARGELTPE
jgi:6-phosphogluconolactonase